MNYKIVETPNGKAIYVKSSQIADDMHYAEKNNIKNIIISQYENQYTLNNVDFLEHYLFIENVTISTWENIDYSALKHLKNLKILNINILAIDKGELDFNDFPNLEDLGVAWNNKRKNISSLKNLKILGLIKYKSKNLNEFSSLLNLEKLILGQSTIESLEGIESLVNLKRLSLFKNKKLTSLKGLENLTSLVDLEIDECKSLESIEEVSQLKNLKAIKIENCGAIEDFRL